MTETPLPSPGWYPDPSGSEVLRWWDGERWTDSTHPLPGGEAAPPPSGSLATAPRHRHGRAIALVAGFLVILLVAVVVLALGLNRTRLATKGVEEQIADEIANQLDVATTVTCPDLVDAGKGLSFTCDVKLDNGNTATVKVTQKDDRGTVTWDVVPAQ